MTARNWSEHEMVQALEEEFPAPRDEIQVLKMNIRANDMRQENRQADYERSVLYHKTLKAQLEAKLRDLSLIERL